MWRNFKAAAVEVGNTVAKVVGYGIVALGICAAIYLGAGMLGGAVWAHNVTSTVAAGGSVASSAAHSVYASLPSFSHNWASFTRACPVLG